MASFSFSTALSVLLWCVVSASYIPTSPPLKSERDLRQDIFRNYDKLVRPVADPSKAIPLDVKLSIVRIKELNTHDSLLVVDTWIVMSWKDDYLKWDPLNNNNITTISVPNDQVWKPDLAFYTATPDSTFFPEDTSRVQIYNDGRIIWVPPFTLHSVCPVQSGKKTTTCNIRFGSWTYSGFMLDINLSKPGVELDDFKDTNKDWKLVSAVSSKEKKFYSCCEEDYPFLHFNLTLKNRSGTYLNEVKHSTEHSTENKSGHVNLPASLGGARVSGFVGRMGSE